MYECFLTIQAILSHSVGLDELYVQNVSDNRAMDYMKLQEEVNGHCPTAPSVTSPQTGLVYGGLFSEDNAWYRCRLISVQPDRNVSLITLSLIKQWPGKVSNANCLCLLSIQLKAGDLSVIS